MIQEIKGGSRLLNEETQKSHLLCDLYPDTDLNLHSLECTLLFKNACFSPLEFVGNVNELFMVDYEHKSQRMSLSICVYTQTQKLKCPAQS